MFVWNIDRSHSVKGYLDKGLVETHNLYTRHAELAQELKRRGYKHNSELDVKWKLAKKAGSIDTATKPTDKDIKTIIFAYTWQRKKEGLAEPTIESYTIRLNQLAKICNLNNPEEVKQAIATGNQSNNTKRVSANAYTDFLKFKGQKWQKPHYKLTRTLPFIPLEKEIDELISASSKTTSTLLQLLKETGIRISEATKLKRVHIDTERRTANITASKGSNPRILPISPKLIGMLNNLKKRKDENIFHPKPRFLRTNFQLQRKRIAKKLNNPRLKQIHFHTLRHWKGTTEYHKTKDIYHVKHVLGHKSLTSTEVYINIEQATFLTENSEYHSATAKTIQEATQLIETGFEYVTEIDGTKLFKKRK